MKRSLGLLGALIALPGVAYAVSTRSFVIETSEAFEKGTVQGASVFSSGRVARSVDTARTPVDGVPVAYASAVGPDGAIYLATGNEGAIYRLAKDQPAKLFADTPAALVTSLVWADGTLYAGTLPGGQVFAIDGTGKTRELAKLAAEHVWGLAVGDKTVYAATGPEGKLFSIDAAGRSQSIYDDTAEHLLCVARDKEGRLYVGTSNGARVVRIAGKESRVLYDFPGQEVTSLELGKGFIAVAANDFPAPATPSSDNKDLGTAARAKRNKPGTGNLYALGYDGFVRELARFDSAHISALEIDPRSDDVNVGLGHDGRIYRVAQSGERALWADVDERAIAALHLLGNAPHFVSSDGVAVYRVQGGDKGTWTSQALDAKVPARFGELTFRARGTVRWETRSGNTENPDEGWSAWSNALTTAGPIKSPAARFLQLRASLLADAELYAVEAYYLPQNQAARVRNVRAKLQREDASKPHTSVIALSWDTDNPDDDKLRHHPSVRREGQSQWLPLLRDYELLESAEYSWETRNVPDGYYRVRVVVSDEASNPAPYVATAEAISAPILVDNHAPELRELKQQGPRIVGRARDELGPIASLEVQVDNGLFQPLFPDDDLLDTRDEPFHFDLPQLSPGVHVVAVRASDAARNTVLESLEVSAPTR